MGAEQSDAPATRALTRIVRDRRRNGLLWAAIAAVLLALLVAGVVADHRLGEQQVLLSQNEAMNTRQGDELVKSAGSISGLSNDVLALKDELAKRGVDPDTIAPDPADRVQQPTLVQTSGMSVDEITAYVTTYLAANRPKDGRTPTPGEVRAVVMQALAQTCGGPCRGADGAAGDPGTDGAPGSAGLNGEPGPAGAPGDPGADAPPPTSVTGATVNADNHLILTLSNGVDVTQVDAGALPPGPQGAQGDKGSTGEQGEQGEQGQPPVQWVTSRADGSIETCKRDDPFDAGSPSYSCTQTRGPDTVPTTDGDPVVP